MARHDDYHRKTNSEGQKRAWANPDIRARRSAAIAKAFDDPLFRARMSQIKIKPGSRRWNAGEYDGK
jgi:cellulase/cellobiase CelA1